MAAGAEGHALRGDVHIGQVGVRGKQGRHVHEHVGGNGRASERMRHGVTT